LGREQYIQNIPGCQGKRPLPGVRRQVRRKTLFCRCLLEKFIRMRTCVVVWYVSHQPDAAAMARTPAIKFSFRKGDNHAEQRVRIHHHSFL
jgi:hypothetical protein